ncbi:phosphoglycolate phosphatase [Mesorhizobium xinjiangense]|uniref:phosphoglycolate phosphatase n=1 Tax=Mesorhizobium xinjiangense TaxID=2678685 RepID=UPI0012EDA7EE|nr:phosphoglycolate phosphatase [Mesorhizobium xinjiangense]
MSASTPTIVFDLDGTLVDTAADLVASLNHALTTAGYEPEPYAAMRPYVGHGARAMIERVHAARRIALPQSDLDALLAAFLDHYAKNIPSRSAPYPGALAMLDRFAERGYRLAVCTNKREALADELLGALDMAPRFAAICGADTFPFRKPDPRHLTQTVLRAGGAVECAVMVGDSRTDIDTAKAAGVPVIAVDHGYSDRHVGDFEPSAVISHFDELTPDFADRMIRAVAN